MEFIKEYEQEEDNTSRNRKGYKTRIVIHLSKPGTESTNITDHMVTSPTRPNVYVGHRNGKLSVVQVRDLNDTSYGDWCGLGKLYIGDLNSINIVVVVPNKIDLNDGKKGLVVDSTDEYFEQVKDLLIAYISTISGYVRSVDQVMSVYECYELGLASRQYSFEDWTEPNYGFTMNDLRKSIIKTKTINQNIQNVIIQDGFDIAKNDIYRVLTGPVAINDCFSSSFHMLKNIGVMPTYITDDALSYIQLAAFQSEESANKFSNLYNSFGYNTFVSTMDIQPDYNSLDYVEHTKISLESGVYTFKDNKDKDAIVIDNSTKHLLYLGYKDAYWYDTVTKEFIPLYKNGVKLVEKVKDEEENK